MSSEAWTVLATCIFSCLLAGVALLVNLQRKVDDLQRRMGSVEHDTGNLENSLQNVQRSVTATREMLIAEFATIKQQLTNLKP